MKKNGFIPIDKSNFVAACIFIVVCIIAFTPFVYQSMWNGLNCSIWTLSGIALLVPIYNIIADNAFKSKNAGRETK